MKFNQPKIDPIPFTKEGFEKIQKEQEQLLIDRVDALSHLQKSREMGDLKENGYYQASRQKMNSIDSRLRRIKFLLKYGVVRTATQSEIVEIGSTVTLKVGNDEVTYQVVGGEESNPSEGRISHHSPLGKAILRHKTGEKITLVLPAGSTDYLIKKIA